MKIFILFQDSSITSAVNDCAVKIVIHSDKFFISLFPKSNNNFIRKDFFKYCSSWDPFKV